jgi:hypothetical protein
MSHKRCWAVAFGITVMAFSLGCADQGEGERCDPLSGDEDCATGLVCMDLGETALRTTIARCCPPEGEKISDHRCIRQSPPASAETGGSVSSDAGLTGGQAGSGGGSPSNESQGGTAGSVTSSEQGQSAASGVGGAAGAGGA